MNIGMFLFPHLTQLDLTGPYEVFIRLPETKIFLLAKDRSPIPAHGGLAILPDTPFENAPALDIVFVPGGPGVNAMLQDDLFLRFLQEQGQNAAYVTSVCTGALLLAAAGLLDGYRATTHWLSLDLLRLFPNVEVVPERVVIDRNRMTGGGVTAGIDFGLTLAGRVFGRDIAEIIQLGIAYNPAPPYRSGSPDEANPVVLEQIKHSMQHTQQERRTIIERLLSARV